MTDVSSPELIKKEQTSSSVKIHLEEFKNNGSSVSKAHVDEEGILQKEEAIREELAAKVSPLKSPSQWERLQQKAAFGLARIMTDPTVIKTSAEMFGREKPLDINEEYVSHISQGKENRSLRQRFQSVKESGKLPVRHHAGPSAAQMTNQIAETARVLAHHPDLPVRFAGQLGTQILRRLIGG